MKKEQKIDLSNRLMSTEKQKLNGWVSFTALTVNDKNLDELAAMAHMLKQVGVSIEVTRKENKEAGPEYDFIVLKINKEQYNKVLTRHAGRKADFNQKYDKYGKCTVAELQDKLQNMTKTKIAQELGCSRMTLYRILKNITKLNPAGDTSIWHYTS